MENQITIISPIPGVFYSKPGPDQPDFVVPGQEVKAGDVIGLVEIMKTFYEIKTEKDGVVERIVVESEDVVDPGQEIAILTVK
jgi:acetyl-CoA carboxylase biotin carboxyl carrier protein